MFKCAMYTITNSYYKFIYLYCDCGLINKKKSTTIYLAINKFYKELIIE